MSGIGEKRSSWTSADIRKAFRKARTNAGLRNNTETPSEKDRLMVQSLKRSRQSPGYNPSWSSSDDDSQPRVLVSETPESVASQRTSSFFPDTEESPTSPTASNVSALDNEVQTVDSTDDDDTQPMEGSEHIDSEGDTQPPEFSQNIGSAQPNAASRNYQEDSNYAEFTEPNTESDATQFDPSVRAVDPGNLEHADAYVAPPIQFSTMKDDWFLKYSDSSQRELRLNPDRHTERDRWFSQNYGVVDAASLSTGDSHHVDYAETNPRQDEVGQDLAVNYRQQEQIDGPTHQTPPVYKYTEAQWPFRQAQTPERPSYKQEDDSQPRSPILLGE